MLSDTYRIWNPDEYDYGHAFGFLPKLTSYLHGDSKKRGCVLVVPGGGYCSVSPTEGELVALNFYEKGYQAFVLTYKVNPLQMEPLRLQPLKDISRAMRYIRKFSIVFMWILIVLLSVDFLLEGICVEVYVYIMMI